MDKQNQENILALSWNIATEPKLYRELAPNPYTPRALQIISERFPDFSIGDTIKAVVLAEPEGKYDRNFRQLSQELQIAELNKQTNETNEIARRLNEFYSQHALKFAELSEDLTYDILLKTAFGITSLQEIEQKYAQNQRKYIKLLILSLISEANIFRFKEKQASHMFVPKITFALLSVISFFYLTFIVLEKQSLIANATNRIIQGQTQNTIVSRKVNEQVLSAEAQKESTASPVRLIIPGINIDAVIEDVGLTSGGAMEVSNNVIDVGWYKLGPSPGETGSAVIAGHFDGREGNSGVFNNLDKLKQGDKIYVVNDQGVITAFVVRESRTYDPGYADEVFFPNDKGIHLNLVTCDGTWDKNKKSYSKRLVVFADIVKE